jgi:hypothetical protein
MFELMPERFDGIGFVFTPYDPYAGIDYDDVFIDGVLIPEVREEIERIDSYTEISQSNRGLHVIVEATSPYHINGIPKQCKISAYGTLNSTSRYFAITGNVLDQHTTINPRQDIIDRIYQKNKPVISAPVRTSSRPISSSKIGDAWGVRIEDFMPDNPRVMGAGRYQGSNPFHGSTTGNNYSVDTREGIWHCYRDRCGGTGGDALIAFCVREGILDCSDCKPGVMSKIDYPVLFRKLEECGYKDPEKEKGRDFLKRMGMFL